MYVAGHSRSGRCAVSVQVAMDEVAYWDSRIAAMDRRVQRKTTAAGLRQRSGGREIKQEVKKANAVMSEIDLPWEALFDSVEYAIKP